MVMGLRDEGLLLMDLVSCLLLMFWVKELSSWYKELSLFLIIFSIPFNYPGFKSDRNVC